MSPPETSQITPRKSTGLSVGEIIALLALIIGILLVITPVNALSRSAFLLIVLGASIYLFWGAPWRIREKRSFKIALSGLLSAAYIVVVIWLFVVERKATATNPGTAMPTGDSNAISMVTTWVSARIIGLWNMPWRWMLLGAGLAALAIRILGLLRQKQRKSFICPSKRLHEIAEEDKQRIVQLVKIYGVSCQTHIVEGGPPPYINFRFAIYNMALQQVAIDDALKGSLVFWKDGFTGESWKLRRDATIEDNHARNCLFRGQHQLTVRQDLTPEEATYISSGSKDSFFRFAALTITMRGEGFSDKRLNTDFSVKRDGRYWADTPEYIFAGDDDKAKPILGPRLTHQELIQRIEALPPDKRAMAHKLAIDMYGATLYLRDPPKEAGGE